MIRVTNKKSWNIWFILFCCFILISNGTCKKKEANNEDTQKSKTCKKDPFYKYDIHYNGSKRGSFHYPPKEFPVIGKTTEDEVYEMYNYTVNPDTRSSLKKAVVIQIKNKKIKVDKWIQYRDYKKTEKRYKTEDGGYAFERKHSQYIDYYILLHKGIVVHHTTAHFIKKQEDWVPGKYHNGYSRKLRKEKFPGKNYLGCMYMLQHPASLCEFGKVYTQAECNKDLKDSL